MTVHSHINSLFNSMSYVFNGILIDPGDVWNGFNNVSIVLLTHAHFDHIYGLNELLMISPTAKVYTNVIGKEMLLNARKNLSAYHETPFVLEYPESVVNDRETVDLGNGLTAKVVFTPGHNSSCISWIIDNMVFSGDSLIPGVKTATNLPGGDKEESKRSEKLIRQLIINRDIFPGHQVLTRNL